MNKILKNIIILFLIIVSFNINASEVIYGVIGDNLITNDNLIIETKDGGSVIYDPETEILTLNNFNMDLNLYEDKNYNMLIGIASKNGTIELIGENNITLNTSSNKETYIFNLGYDNKSSKNTSFSIIGSGKLNIKDNNHSNKITYINNNSNKLNIINTKINIDILCNKNDSIKLINSNDLITISNSIINLNTSKGNINNLTGINSKNNIFIEDSNIKITLGNYSKSNNISNMVSSNGSINLIGSTIKLINNNESNGTLYKCKYINYDESEQVLKDFKYTFKKNGEVFNYDEVKEYNHLKGYYLYNKSYSYETICETCIINNGTKGYTLNIEGNYNKFKELSIDGIKYINNIDYHLIGKEIKFTTSGLNKLSLLSEGTHKVQISYLNERNSFIDLDIKTSNSEKEDPVLLSLAAGITGLLGLLGIAVYVWRKYYKV